MIDDDVRTALARIPLFAGHDAEAFEVRRLGGLTNRVYRVALGAEAWCLRLPGQGTEAYIDRKVEAVNARAAAGVSPEVLFFDPMDGVMVTRFLGDVVTMSLAGFRERPGSPKRAGAVFR